MELDAVTRIPAANLPKDAHDPLSLEELLQHSLVLIECPEQYKGQ